MICPAITGYLNCFNKFRQIIADKHDIRALAGNIGSRTHRHANGSHTEGGRVVDAVA